MREKTIRKEQIVVYQGEAVYGVHVITSGIVRAYTILGSGNEVNVALYGPGDYFPVETAYETAPATLFYYEALTDCTLQTHRGDAFRELQASQPDAHDAESKRYVGALLHVNALGQATAYDKLGHALRYLTLRFGLPLAGKGFYRIDMKLTQQDLANLCTMSRETVSIELAKLKAKKAVLEKSKLYTVNLPLLTQLLGDDNLTDVTL
jgi:CRP-like cAMP-binding protein